MIHAQLADAYAHMLCPMLMVKPLLGSQDSLAPQLQGHPVFGKHFSTHFWGTNPLDTRLGKDFHDVHEILPSKSPGKSRVKPLRLHHHMCHIVRLDCDVEQ